MKINNLIPIQDVLEGIRNLRPRLGSYDVGSIISFFVLYIQRILNNLELGKQIPGIHNLLLSKSQWRKNARTMCVEDELEHLASSFPLSIIQWHAWRTNARTHVQLGYECGGYGEILKFCEMILLISVLQEFYKIVVAFELHRIPRRLGSLTRQCLESCNCQCISLYFDVWKFKEI